MHQANLAFLLTFLYSARFSRDKLGATEDSVNYEGEKKNLQLHAILTAERYKWLSSFSTNCIKQSEFSMQQEGTSLSDGFLLLPTPVTPSCESLQHYSSEWSSVQAGICESSSLPHLFLHYFTHLPESCWKGPAFHWCIRRWEDSPLPHKENPFYFYRNVNRRAEFSYKQILYLLPSESVNISANCIKLFLQRKQNCTVSQTKAVQCLWGKDPPLHLMLHTADAASFSCLNLFSLLFISALGVTADLSQFILPEEVGQNCISTWDGIFPKTCIVSILFSFVTPSEAF